MNAIIEKDIVSWNHGDENLRQQIVSWSHGAARQAPGTIVVL